MGLCETAIVTDTTSMIPPALVDAYGVCCIPLTVIFGSQAMTEGEDLSLDEFYRRLVSEKQLPTTSPASPGSYLKAFSTVAGRARSILCLTVSQRLSGTYVSAVKARDVFVESHPDWVSRIHVADSGTAAAAQGIVAIEAARAAFSGGSLADIVALVTRLSRVARVYAFLDTMDYLARSGRVPKALCWAGSMLNIKPIFTIKDGLAHPVTRARSKARAMAELLAIVKREIGPDPGGPVGVMHTACEDDARWLAESIEEAFPGVEAILMACSPVMATHMGPGAVGVGFFSAA